MGMEALGGYFDNLAAAETNKKAVLEEVVTNFNTITTSNSEMANTIKELAWENCQLQQQLKSFQKKQPQEDLRGARKRQPAVGRDKKLCPNCKQEVWHRSNDFFELANNTARRPLGWTTRLWRC